MRIRAYGPQLFALAVVGVHIEDVLRVLVQGVAPGGRTAHAHLERRLGEIRECHVNDRVVMLGCGKRDEVHDRRLCRGDARNGEQDQDCE